MTVKEVDVVTRITHTLRRLALEKELVRRVLGHVPEGESRMLVDEARLYREIGMRLRQRRKATGLTQTQLADAIGVLRTSITNIEAGRQRLPLYLLYACCAALGVEVSSILPTTDEILQPTTVSVDIDGGKREVPPRTAEFLQRLLAE